MSDLDEAKQAQHCDFLTGQFNVLNCDCQNARVQDRRWVSSEEGSATPARELVEEDSPTGK